MPETYWRDAYDTLKKRVSELENELKRVEIIATAKAVVVPEGKGIFWTNKIASLREEIKNGDIMVLEPLMKDIAELQTKQQLITGELQNLNIWRRKHLGKYNALKEALRELLEWWKKPEFAQDIDTFRENREKKFKELMKKLSGEKSEDDLTPGTARASSTDSKPESCQTCLYENNMKDDNTCGMCNPNTPQSHWTPKKKEPRLKSDE